MASKGYVESLINRLDATTRVSLKAAFEHVLDTLQIGGIEHQEKAINFRMIRLDSTTAATANEEFSILHGLGTTPLHLLPLVPVSSSGAQLVRLKTSRAADASRIYLQSPDTGAPFSVLVEY